MLKVIAEDFIQSEAIEIVMPLYRELVAATKQEPLCISYDLYVDQKILGTLFLSRSGRIKKRSIFTVPANISNA